MSFRYTEKNREAYQTAGLTVLQGLIPASLLSDLRHETDKAREIARSKFGPQCQRLQPVYTYEELNHQPFRDFLDLPELRKTVLEILGPGHAPSEIMGVLLEPSEKPWCTNWHRDWAHHIPGLENSQIFLEAIQNLGMFNQLNGALYEDHSLWAVPASHQREDTEAERTAFGGVPAPGPSLPSEMSNAERELACLAYAHQMPGATLVPLHAGDVAFYRASLWHIGNYLPYTRRATLHDGFYSSDDLAWREKMRQIQENRQSVAK